MLRFEGKTVVVTGAGGGLGREYALLFAERGASVVVNDLGSSSTGGGHANGPADLVVQEITGRGGKAVANYDSVENGEKIIKSALDAFGRIDVIVNNAGILRDKRFKNISEEDWDTIFRVHVKGAFSLVKAAWDQMCLQKYGRIIMTSSNSGVYGNFGQANYSAAKAALIGFSNTLSKEGQNFNVFSNVIVPTAASRLTKSIIPDEVFEKFKPEFVAPLVLWLCHESCSENGGVFTAAGGWFGKIEPWRSRGKVLLDSNQKVLPEYIRDNWKEVADMDGAKHFDSLTNEIVDVVENVNFYGDKRHLEESSKPRTYIDPQRIKSRHTRYEPLKFEYQPKDAILYALSIGASVEKHPHLLYECHENFTVFPLFAVVPNANIAKQLIEFEIPKLKLDLTKLLHGEQYFEFKKPIPTSGRLISHCKLVDAIDKGNATIPLLNVELKDMNDELIVFGQYKLFFRDAGGFDGFPTSKFDIPTVPVPSNRKADFVSEEKTSLNQAAFYRQTSGDYNPLHIDPNFAKLAGLSSPILHGLCTLGIATRQILDRFSPNDYSRLRTLKVRFTKPVFPGQTLVTEMWKGVDGRVHFQTKVKETGKIVLGDGYADFSSGTPQSSIKPSNNASSQKIELKCRPVFEMMQQRLSKDPNIAKQIQAVYLWTITKDGKDAAQYTMDLKTGNGSIYQGEPKSEKQGVTLTIEDQDMVDLVSGKLNPQKAFMGGKLKIKGNIMLTQKLQKLFNDSSKL